MKSSDDLLKEPTSCFQNVMNKHNRRRKVVHLRVLSPSPLLLILLLLLLLAIINALTIKLSANFIQQAAAYCDRTFLSAGDNNDAPLQHFVAPSGVHAKQYKLYKNEQGNLVASKSNLSFTSAAATAAAAAAHNSQQHLTNQSVKQSSAATTFGTAFHCLYKFIAGDDERVAVSFTTFKLRGAEPECNHEYVDIYAQFKSTDQLEDSILNERPNGRFCTTLVPHKVVSLNNMIVLSIYSDLEPPADGRALFSGTFEFVKTNLNEQNIGLPDEGTLCTHTISSSTKREGEFQSVTYPGVYVKNLRCSYKLIGEPKQRIRLEFLDLDLYSGGSHCPFDSIKIFDGLEESDPIIQTICGSHRSLIIYSTHEHLLVTFTTLQREVEIQDRGFSAYFEFSDKFYDPNFIQGANSKHIRGSECDQRIVSTKGSSGQIVSPKSRRDHANAICRYFFEGLQSSHDYEKVLLKFIEFDLKTSQFSSSNQPTTTTTTSTTTTQPPQMGTISSLSPVALASPNLSSPNQVSGNNQLSDSNQAGTNSSSPDQCADNYVRIYTSEQKPDQKQDPNDYDYVFCSNELPTTIESDAASMLMEYNSGSLGGHFKAEYNFIVDYRIPGYQASMGCNYVYRSDLMKTGPFNSPRYPSWYINDMNCSYTFLVKNDEALLLQFTSFKMAKSFNDNVVGYNDVCTNEDSVEINEITLDASEQKIIDQYEIGTYCGTTTPGPILSFRAVQIHFRTNKNQVNYGFGAIYHFHSVSELKTNEFVANCGEQIHATHRQRSGVFSSPPTYRSETYEKRNHICSWNITARPGHKIALYFNQFELEGSPPVRGCATASVRLEFDKSKRPTELCGTLPASNGTGHQYGPDGEWLVVTFISTKQASGSNGFSATWTEIKRTS